MKQRGSEEERKSEYTSTGTGEKPKRKVFSNEAIHQNQTVFTRVSHTEERAKGEVQRVITKDRPSIRTALSSQFVSQPGSSLQSPHGNEKGQVIYKFKREKAEQPISYIQGRKIDAQFKDERTSVEIQTERGKREGDEQITGFLSKQLELRLPSPDLSQSHHTPNSSATRNSIANTGHSQQLEIQVTEERAEEEEECKTASPKILRLNSDEIINQAQRLVKSVRGTTAQNRANLGKTLSSGLFSPEGTLSLSNEAFRLTDLRTTVTSKTASSPFYGVTAMSPQCQKQGQLLTSEYNPVGGKVQDAGVNNWCEYTNKMIHNSKRKELLSGKSKKFYSSMLKSTIPKSSLPTLTQKQNSYIQQVPETKPRVYLSPQQLIIKETNQEHYSQSESGRTASSKVNTRSKATSSHSSIQKREEKRAKTKMTIQQLKVMQTIGAIKAFYEVKHPMKHDELRDRLSRRAPLISTTLHKCVDIFQVHDLPAFQRQRASIEKDQITLQNLTTHQTLMKAAFPDQKPTATCPYTKSINLSQRQEATLLRDWLDFMSKLNETGGEELQLHQRLEMNLMCLSYAMLELRQQISGYCMERGAVLLKVLKLILTIPSLYAALYERRLSQVEEVIEVKRKQIAKERKRDIKEYVEIKNLQEREIKALNDRIMGLKKDNKILSDEVRILKLRINNASGLLQLAQNKTIQEIKEINKKQCQFLLEVYHNSKLDRIFVKENEKMITEDYEKNEFQEAIKDHLQLEQQPQGNIEREFGVSNVIEPQHQKIEIETEIALETLQQLLNFAKKYPQIDNIKRKLVEFERFLCDRIQRKEQQTFTGDDALQDSKSEQDKRNSRLKTNISKKTQNNSVSIHNDPMSTEIAVPLMQDEESNQQESYKDSTHIEPDQEQEERELVQFLLKLKQNKDEEFVTELPVKLRTVIKRFYTSLISLPQDEYGDLLFDPESNSKITNLLRRRGRTLKKILTFLEPDPKIILEAEAVPQEKEVQTQIEGIVSDQAFAVFLHSLTEEKKEGAKAKDKRTSKLKRRLSRSPKERSAKLSPVGERRMTKDPNKKNLTQIRAFKFKKQHPSSLKIHPYQRLLFSLLRRIEAEGVRNRTNSEVSVRFLLKQILGIYNERLMAGKESVIVRNQRFGDFFYDLTLHKYGLVKVTEKKISEVIFSTSLHRKKIPDVELVARFLGVSNIVYSADDLNFYLDFCDSVNQMSNLNFPTFLKKEKNIFAATECYFGVAQQYIRANFQNKLALMIEVPPEIDFKNEKEEYEYYYYYPLPMAIVIMVILDNYKSMKRYIFDKIKKVAMPYILDFQKQIAISRGGSLLEGQNLAEKSLAQSEEEVKIPQNDGALLQQHRNFEPEETMLKLSEVMSIMQSVVFFDEGTYADIKLFFEKNSMVYVMQREEQLATEEMMSFDSQMINEADHSRVSIDLLCSFIFKKKLIEIK